MSNDLEQANRLWRESERYVSLARRDLYLEQRIEQMARLGKKVAELLKPPAGLTLPPGYGLEHQTRVHFLFPNLEPKERAVLSLILLWSDPMGGRQPRALHKKRITELMEQFHELEIMKKVTPVQSVILETRILPRDQENKWAGNDASARLLFSWWPPSCRSVLRLMMFFSG